MSKKTFVANEQEAAILVALYEVANGTYTSHTLFRKLNPTLKPSTAEALTAFVETRTATEQLIARGFVNGDRLSNVDGVYFDKLKLTKTGQQMPIQQKHASEAQGNT